MQNNRILGINASRARSGGARAHLRGILAAADPLSYGFREVHVWSYPQLLQSLPEKPWLVRHSPKALSKSIWSQLIWERLILSNELTQNGCSILLNVDAGTISKFKPAVTMSQNLLPFETGEMTRYGIGLSRLRLEVLRHVHTLSLRRAAGVIFLSRYASEITQKSCGRLSNYRIIYHGVDQAFKDVILESSWPVRNERPINCLYISPISPYKHQSEVIEAIAKLRERGFDISLTLIGGGENRARRRLLDHIYKFDQNGAYIKWAGEFEHSKLPSIFSKADLFIFASSCEAFGITLVEAMSVGLPIACSCKSSLPEILGSAGVYFDPEDSNSIRSAVEKILNNSDLRLALSEKAKRRSEEFTWKRCAEETFKFLMEIQDEYEQT